MKKKIILGVGVMALVLAANLPSNSMRVHCPSGDKFKCYSDDGFVVFKGNGDVIVEP